MAGRTHYDVLGVPSSASSEAIREAYRRLAREHHPDRSGAVAGDDRMHAINEAYRVLNDPARRAVYDAGLRASPTSPAGGPAAPARERSGEPDPPPYIAPSRPLAPGRVPWRMLLALGVLTVAGVVVLAQFTDPGDPPGPDGILRVGDCVTLLANTDAREVPCTGEDDRVVRAFVAFDETCPGLTEPHRDRQGMGIACLDIGG